MRTIEKGNKLEDEFYEYLLGQQDSGELVFDAYPPQNCKIFKNKKYLDPIGNRQVEFDVVVELVRPERTEPHHVMVFECKNHNDNIREGDVDHFSNKLKRVFGHRANGIFVVSSRLQSGAMKVAERFGIGVVKYDGLGFETVADRKISYQEKRLVAAQLIENTQQVKSLKFSAYYGGAFFGRLRDLLSNLTGNGDPIAPSKFGTVPYIPLEKIKYRSREVLEKCEYSGGSVDLREICRKISVDLKFSDETKKDGYGRIILGSANFDRRSIEINAHGNDDRRRFTLAHEIGHFCLRHDRYLRSESVVANDLFIDGTSEGGFNYERLEFQANAFASNLLLPDQFFRLKVADRRRALEIRDRGHGYIFVDDQPCNYWPYTQLLSGLSSDFEASKTAVEIKLTNMGLLTDQRRVGKSPFAQVLSGLTSMPR